MSRRVLPRGVAGPAAFVLVVLLSLVVLFSPGSEVPTGLPVDDKVVHATLFAALAVTGLLARLPLVPLALGLVVYAAASEVLQATLPIHRDGDVGDGLADVLGAVVGLALVLAVRRRRPAGRSVCGGPRARA